MTGVLVGIAGIIVGFFMVWKPHRFVEMIGEQAWFSKVFGPGHGTTGYQTIGIILIFISFLIMTGMIKDIVLWIFT